MLKPHPLQSALDRVSTASYSVVDLLDVSGERLGGNESRAARPDARQTSLYRAAVTASVGGMEELFEGLSVAILEALGASVGSIPALAALIGKQMQTPNSRNGKDLLRLVLPAFNPEAFWQARVLSSAAVFRPRNSRAGGHHLYTIYDQPITITGKRFATVLDRFTNVRHTFAHQDSSKGIALGNEKMKFETLSGRKANSSDERDFVQHLSIACAMTVGGALTQAGSPIQSWTLHQTHAINSLHLLLGGAATLVSGVAEHLEAEQVIDSSAVEPLRLGVQAGFWKKKLPAEMIPLGDRVSLRVTPYAPSSR